MEKERKGERDAVELSILRLNSVDLVVLGGLPELPGLPGLPELGASPSLP